jgi:hypothetical protein
VSYYAAVKFITNIFAAAVPRVAVPSVDGAVGKVAAAVTIPKPLVKRLVDIGINCAGITEESATDKLL